MPQSGRRWMVAGGDSTAGGPLESPCVPQVADPHLPDEGQTMVF